MITKSETTNKCIKDLSEEQLIANQLPVGSYGARVDSVTLSFSDLNTNDSKSLIRQRNSYFIFDLFGIKALSKLLSKPISRDWNNVPRSSGWIFIAALITLRFIQINIFLLHSNSFDVKHIFEREKTDPHSRSDSR